VILRPLHTTAFALFVSLVGAVVGASDARADTPEWSLKATGLVGAPVAHGDERTGRVAVEPSLKWKLPNVEFRFRERIRWLERQGDHRTDADVRELTAVWRRNETTLTLGAQQLNWGRMDVLRVTDVVNPVDQHDLFHEELPEAKLALWMANLEWQSGSQTVQVIATPQVPIDRFPDQWSGMPVQVSKPRTSLRNATLALRYGFEALGWSADVLTVHGWQASPALRPLVDASGLKLRAAMSRQNSIGFSADKPLGSTVLRLEGLYARLTPGEEASGLGFTSRRQGAVGAGLDVRTGAWFFAGQAIAQHDRDATGGSGNNAFTSLIVQRKWLQDRLSARGLYIRETRSGSSWSSLQAAYELSPNQVLQLQGDWFAGDAIGAFGNMRNRSRIAASLRLQF
jgi:hypothetical protein